MTARGAGQMSLLAAALAACDIDPPPTIATSTAPLIGGAVASASADPDPAAVALTSDLEFSFCTGALVSARVVMTAAHCVDMLSGDPDVIVFFGVDLAGDGTRIGVQRAQTHPEWTGELEGNHDIGLVLLTFPAPDDVEPLPLNTDPLVAPDDIGRTVHRVGFGVFDDTTMEADGRKRTGDTAVTIIAQTQDWFLAGDDALRTCIGDSGGPSLIDVDGEQRIAGVHSFGFGCESSDNGDTRVDLYAEEFVIPWINDNDPTCGEDRRCSRVGCIDDPDCTPCGPDGTCTADCALPDVDCTTQDLGEICQADSQCTTDLCVFWTGDPDTHFCSRPCDGDGDCAAGMSCQRVMPFGDICYYDDDPPGVIGSACEEPTDCGSYRCERGVCVSECDLSAGDVCIEGFECTSIDGEDFACHEIGRGDGSCAVSLGGGDVGAAALAILALAAWRRRRRGITCRSRDRRDGRARTVRPAL